MTHKPTQLMTRDEALDLATDHYLAGNIDIQVSDESSNSEVEQALSFWHIRITR